MIINRENNDNAYKYFDGRSRGGLTVPSNELLEFIFSFFTILEFADTLMKSTPVRKLNKSCLEKYDPQSEFTCKRHNEFCRNFATKVLVNIFSSPKKIPVTMLKKEV